MQKSVPANLLDKIFLADRRLLAKTALPIFTVAGTFHEDLKGLHQEAENDQIRDIVFSRAHYSMAIAAAIAAWGKKIDPNKAWLVDPTNYVSGKALSSVKLTDFLGKTIARYSLLKILKDVVDRYGRQKLPILESITPATLYLAQDVKQPILSFHIAVGNILAETGKEVWQMITDPHVRPDYVAYASKANMHFLVFDQETKEEFFLVAKKAGKRIPAEQIEDKVVVTGPPVDKRIIACQKYKKPYVTGDTLNICLTTGGLGTNKAEIKVVLKQLLKEIKRQSSGQNSLLPRIELILYAGTHQDIMEMAQNLARETGVRSKLISGNDPAPFVINQKISQTKIKTPSSKKGDARFKIIYHPQIVDANELLIRHGFPTAQLFITKPSGDMAYDAACSGAAMLTLKEWGEWEFNVRHVFESRKISQKAQTEQIIEQLIKITTPHQITSPAVLANAKINQQHLKAKSWLGEAMQNGQNLEPIFSEGIKNILRGFKS